MDYIPSDHPSYIVCTLPTNNTLPLAILAAVASPSQLISSTIFYFAVAHCFDIDYSDQFQPGTNDVTTCPCTTIPCHNPSQPPHNPKCYMQNHIIFHCLLMAAHRIPNMYTLCTILQSEDFSTKLCKFLH